MRMTRKDTVVIALASHQQMWMLTIAQDLTDGSLMQSPPPGFPRPGTARAPQPVRSTINPAGCVLQHAPRSTAMVRSFL